MEDRRKVPRYHAEISAVLSQPGSESVTAVMVDVLSVQGCCVRGTGLPEAGRKCWLTLQWQGEEIRTEAQVAWKTIQGLAGLKFLSMDQASSETLRELCATLQLQPMPPPRLEDD